MRTRAPKIRKHVAVLLFTAFCLITESGSFAAPGEVRALLFFLEDCDHCRVVKSEVIPGVQAAFPLVVRELDASTIENAWRLLLFERSHGIDEGQVPALAVGSQFLVGEEAIRARLLGLVLDLAAKGGSDWPVDPDPSIPAIPAAPVSDACGARSSPNDACGPGDPSASSPQQMNR